MGPLADAAGVPCINYTGGERTRGEFMFHYQVGSLEEEPAVLARYLARQGRASVAVAHDHSPVGRRYAEFFSEACGALGIDITGVAAVSPLAEDVSPVVARLRSGGPRGPRLPRAGRGGARRGPGRRVREVGRAGGGQLGAHVRLRPARLAGGLGGVGLRRQRVRRQPHPGRACGSARRAARPGPIGVAAYDMGRLVAEAVARAAHLTRAGIKDGLERVKQLPASSGMDGTTMGFGHYDHGALKGRYLVLRQWLDGKTVQVADAVTVSRPVDRARRRRHGMAGTSPRRWM